MDISSKQHKDVQSDLFGRGRSKYLQWLKVLSNWNLFDRLLGVKVKSATAELHFTRGVIIYLATIYRNTKMQQYVSWIVTRCIVYRSRKMKITVHEKKNQV